MKRKTVYVLALLFLVVDIAIAAVLIEASAQRLSALSGAATAVVELVREFIRPLPRL